MIPGAISNSWRIQLADQDLSDLVEQAQSQGAQHVELRQTCLGNYETGEGDDWRLGFPRMQSLVDRFPQLTFDLAMALPCLTQSIDPKGGLFQAAWPGPSWWAETVPTFAPWTPGRPVTHGRSRTTFRRRHGGWWN